MNASSVAPTGLTRVEFGQGESRSGTFRQVGRRRWVEDSVAEGTDRFEFEESGRGASSVDLYDASRDVTIQLDEEEMVVRWGTGRSATVPIYTISAATDQAHGWTANRVEFGSTGSHLGTFRQIDESTWFEDGVEGVRDRFRFDEERRDDWTVYLRDPKRDVRLQLDLHRRQVLLATEAGTATLYEIIDATATVTGWMVDRVEIGDGSTVTGTLRQTDRDLWTEDNIEHGAERFWFDELQRDDWSVHLFDEDRNMSLVLDLRTRKVLVGSGRVADSPLYDIVSATDDALPPAPPAEEVEVRPADVNRVEFGSRQLVTGVLRQVDRSTWVEDGVEQGRDRFHYDEVDRDANLVRLHDRSRNISLEIDLRKRRVRVGEGTTARRKMADIVVASNELSGWLTSDIEFNANGASITMRQLDWSTWEEITDGGGSRLLAEVERGDWTVRLVDPEQSRSIVADLYTRRVTTEAPGSATSIHTITAAGGDNLPREMITSISRLTADRPLGQGPPGDTVYRTTITVSPSTTWVNIWASEETRLLIGGKEFLVDPVKPARVTPNATASVVVTIPIDALRCPTLRLQTNLMKPGNRHVVAPDADALNKLASMRRGTFKKILDDSGDLERLGKPVVDGVEKAAKELSRTVQPVAVPLPSGAEQQLKMGAKRRSSAPGFVLDLSDGADTVFRPLTAQEAGERIATAQADDAGVGQFIGTADPGEVLTFLFEAPRREADRIKTGLETGLTILSETAGEESPTATDVDDPGDVLDNVDFVLKVAGIEPNKVLNGIADLFDLEPIFAAHDALLELFEKGIADTRSMYDRAAAELQSNLKESRRSNRASSRVTPKAPRISKASDDALNEAQDQLSWFFDQLLGGSIEVSSDAGEAFEDIGEGATSIGQGLVGFARDPAGTLLRVARDPAGGLADVTDTAKKAILDSTDPMAQPGAPRLSAATSESYDPIDAITYFLERDLPSDVQPELLSLLGDVSTAIGKAGDSLGEALSELVATIAAELNGPKVNADSVVAAVLTVIGNVGEIAADVLEEIVAMLIEMGRIAIDEVLAVLTRPLPETPFLTELYRSRPGGRSLNLIGITALAGGFPLAVLYRAQTGNRSFPAGVAALTRQDSMTVASSKLYAGMKYLQSFISVALMIRDVKARVPVVQGMTMAALMDLVVGIGLQIQGNPIPPGSDLTELDLERGWTTPQHWALATWRLQWLPNIVIPALKVVIGLRTYGASNANVPLAIATNPLTAGAPLRSLSEVWKSDPAAAVTTVVEAIVGLVHIVFFSGLAVSDAARGAELERRRAAIPPQQLSDEEELYRAWANSDGAIAAKFIGNLAGALPSCAPLAALFHPAGALVAPAANLAEAITYTARTASSAIY